MEENNLINNDNTYNTDMSTSQSTIDGNATTNNKFNKDDLQEVTGGGGGGIVTPPTTIVDGSETSQQTGTLTPILLILGDGTTTPDVDEEPVLLEEDEDITYKAVINSDYESNIPTINLEGSEVSYCDANYVIAVTETDKNIPVSYSSTNLSISFTNNQDWCSVIFKSPLEVADQLKLPLNSDNFTDNSKIIVPVISCEENNTGQERNTTITFNIKNVAISHNIQMNVIQNKLEKLKPIMLYYDNGNYTKLSNCPVTFTIKKHNDAIMDSSLCVFEIESWGEGGIHKDYVYDLFYTSGTKKQIYLGYEDTNKIFTNKLSSVITTQVTTLESDTGGCSAKAYLIQNDNTGAPIKYSLNKCTADRIITFSYNNTPIFKINQTYDNSGSSTTKTYIIYVCSIGGTDFSYHNGFALFDTNNPVSFSIPEYGNQINDFTPYYRTQNIYVLAYTQEKMLMTNNVKIGTLLKNGQLTHLSDHDYLTQDKYKDLYLDYVNSVNHFEQDGIGNGTFSTTAITFDMDINVYINQQDAYVISSENTFNFNKLDRDNHLGVYRLTTTL